MSTAIIGNTGFVGGNLIGQKQFDDFYNSKNIESIIGKDYELVICSGTPAAKWLANKEPIKDRENLQRLINCLEKVSIQKLILISTVDAYPIPVNVDEDTEINIEVLQPYGKHRLELEKFVQEHFDALIIRLPGLFGKGLKKNIIYDFLNDNIGDWIHKDSVFQFYNLEYLWRDISIALKNNLKLVNFSTEPVSVQEVAKEAFGFEFTESPLAPLSKEKNDIKVPLSKEKNDIKVPLFKGDLGGSNISHNPVQYDMKSKYFQLFEGYQPGYLYSKNQVLMDLKKFVSKQHEIKR